MGITLLSLLVAPQRGLLAEFLRKAKQKRQVQVDSVLADLYRLAAQHDDPLRAPHALDVLRAMGEGAAVRAGLSKLAEQGLVDSDTQGNWRLTASGLDRGRDLVEGSP
jgi:manganese/zinc/iron transport system permease protein